MKPFQDILPAPDLRTKGAMSAHAASLPSPEAAQSPMPSVARPQSLSSSVMSVLLQMQSTQAM